MEFISSGSGVDNRQKGYFFRMQYPIYYKSDSTKIIKFDRDYNNTLEYTFYGLFPIGNMIIGMYIVKIMIAVIDTPFMYLAKFYYKR